MAAIFLEYVVSAVRVPQEPERHSKHSKKEGASEASSPAESYSHVRYPEGKAGLHSRAQPHSPARRLQHELVERLHRPKPVSLRAILAMLAVLCLSMSIATLTLLSGR